MKQICPECLKSVEVPESAAGTDFPCPVCGAKIPVPKQYTPSVTVPPPPPPVVVERPAPPPGLNVPTIPPAYPSSVPPSFPAGDGKDVGVTLVPWVMEWIVPIGLTVVFVLTFFTWVGSYPGGYRVFAQSGWDTLFGAIDPVLVPTDWEDAEKKLDAVVRSDKLMIPYFLLLIPTLLLAWAEKFIKEINPVTGPGALAWLIPIWPRRFQLLAVLASLLLVFLVLQAIRGFGLDNAVRQYAAEKFDADTTAADTAAKKVAVQVKVGAEQARFAVRTTTWFAAALLIHAVVVVAILIRTWLARRPTKPYPRVVLRY